MQKELLQSTRKKVNISIEKQVTKDKLFAKGEKYSINIRNILFQKKTIKLRKQRNPNSNNDAISYLLKKIKN